MEEKDGAVKSPSLPKEKEKKGDKKMSNVTKFVIAFVLSTMIYAISFFAVTGIYYAIAYCFGLAFTWKKAFCIYLLLVLIKAMIKHRIKTLEE